MPKRIPVEEAKRVCVNQKCKQVIIIAWDGERTHIVTYGVDKEQCRQAAFGGDMIRERFNLALREKRFNGVK